MDWNHHHATINGIRMHYVEQGDGPCIVLCHGFPHLWFSWHRQISALARAGYRVIVPDMRGMGQTEAPSDPAAYDVDHITADLTGLYVAVACDFRTGNWNVNNNCVGSMRLDVDFSNSSNRDQEVRIFFTAAGSGEDIILDGVYQREVGPEQSGMMTFRKRNL